MNVDLNPSIKEDEVIAVDSTGIKVANRGEWVRSKWKVRRGFIKIHLAVDVKQIVSMKVTKEDAGDGRMLKQLVDDALKKAGVTKVIGAYDTKQNFTYLHERNIEACIKVRRNTSTKANGCMSRKIAAIEQLKDPKLWKKKHDYGLRWVAESATSALKRTFGEHITSIKWSNIIKELIIKATIYNLFTKIKQ